MWIERRDFCDTQKKHKGTFFIPLRWNKSQPSQNRIENDWHLAAWLVCSCQATSERLRIHKAIASGTRVLCGPCSHQCSCHFSCSCLLWTAMALKIHVNACRCFVLSLSRNLKHAIFRNLAGYKESRCQIERNPTSATHTCSPGSNRLTLPPQLDQQPVWIRPHFAAS